MPEIKEEQLSAIHHNHGNLLVSASAGSGKTFVMIERLIRLVKEGKATVDSVLCVTFTEASALDMKQRLKTELYKTARETKDERVISQLSEIDLADISTLHAFCLKLIRKYFFIAGVSPDFKIADSTLSAELKRRAIDGVFKNRYEQLYIGNDLDGAGFSSIVNRHSKKRSDKQLKELITSLYEYAQAEKDPQAFLEKIEQYYTPTGFTSVLEGLKDKFYNRALSILRVFYESASLFLKNGAVTAHDSVTQIISDIEKVINADNIYAIKEFFPYGRRLLFGRLKEELKLDKEKCQLAFHEWKNLIGDFVPYLTTYEQDLLVSSEIADHTRSLNQLVKEFSQEYSTLKGEENVLDFNDLEKYALKILSSPEVLQAVKEKYTHVFVDEYQDVNAVQESIIQLVANDNVFMVGDAKQSIYGFRGCRAEFFMEKFDRMQKVPNETVLLNHNFRSSKAVVEMVNQVFDYCMTKESCDIDYRATSRLKYGGLFPETALGRAQLHFLRDSRKITRIKETPRIYNPLEHIDDAQEDSNVFPTSTLIANIIEDELNKTYFDVKEGKEKKVNYGDIVILTRNKDNAYVNRLVKGLTKLNVPVISESSDNVCNYHEVEVLISILKLINCFSDDVPLVSALKSPIGNVTNTELLAIVNHYRSAYPLESKRHTFHTAYEYYLQKGDGTLKEKLTAFDEYYKDVRFLADFNSAYYILTKIIKDKNLESYYYATRSGEEKVKRIHAFINASVSGEKNLSVKAFLDKIATDPDSITLKENASEDNVRVMTIHASKGLEFPVVIVCGLERKINAIDEREEVMRERSFGYAVKRYNDLDKTFAETPVRGLIKQKLRENRIKEEMRLFYVALTRAKYSLHLTCAIDKEERSKIFSDASKLCHYLPLSLPFSEHFSFFEESADKNNQVRQVLIGKADESALNKMQKDFAFVYPNLSDTTLPIKSSVTEANKRSKEEYYKVEELFSTENKTSIELGNVAHKIMELADFDSTENFIVQAEKIIKDFGYTEKAKGLNLDRICKTKEKVSNVILSGGKMFREKSFLSNVPANLLFETDSNSPVLVQGTIDLLVINGDEAEIIDYKYSSKSAKSLIESYKKQIELYSYAVEKGLKKKVTNKYLVNLLSGELLKID